MIFVSFHNNHHALFWPIPALFFSLFFILFRLYSEPALIMTTTLAYWLYPKLFLRNRCTPNQLGMLTVDTVDDIGLLFSSCCLKIYIYIIVALYLPRVLLYSCPHILILLLDIVLKLSMYFKLYRHYLFSFTPDSCT